MNRSDRQHVLELKIPPAVLVALTGALMWLVATATPAAVLVIPGRRLDTTILMLTGVVISGLGFSNPNAYGLGRGRQFLSYFQQLAALIPCAARSKTMPRCRCSSCG